MKQWKEFCQRRRLNHLVPDVDNVLEFLSFLFHDKNLSYTAINTARCALSSFCVIAKKHTTIGSHPLVSKFMRGVFNLKPPVPRYAQVWDVTVVLNYLRRLAPAKMLSLKQMSHKVVVLIALISAQRAQSLHKLRLDKCAKEQGKFIFFIDEPIKQSRPGRIGCKLELPAYPPDRRLCIVTYLKRYIEMTQPMRKQENALLLSYKQPHNKVTTQTISRWIKCTLHAAGVDTLLFKPHSTRAAASSAALRMQVPVDQILSVAGWSSERTFRQFYNKPVQKTGTFANTILDSVKQQD